MASPGSLLPGGFSLGRLSHADRVGLVYRARPTDASDKRTACALVLHPLHVEELRDWFEKMAVLGRSLRHPNLVEVYALGYTSNDLPVVVTEWVDGRTLRAELASGRVFQSSEVLKILRDVSSALSYLHSRTPPVLHRALMPETVMITAPLGTVKVLAVGHADRPHHPAAKPSSLSPEELMGESLGVHSDVFSLATFAYELLTGRPAFAGGTMQVLTAMRHGVLPSVAAITHESAAPLDHVLRRAWSFEPGRRQGSVAELLGELESARSRVPDAALSTRRVTADHATRLTMSPPLLPGSAGLRASTAPMVSSRPPGTRPAPVDVVRARVPTGQFPAVGAAVSPGPRAAAARPRRASEEMVMPRIATAHDVDASALLPFATAREETTVRVPREEIERHGPIDVGDAFVSLGSGVIDDPEVIAVIAREREAELEEKKRSEPPPPNVHRESIEVARGLRDIGEDVTQSRGDETRRPRRRSQETRTSSAPPPALEAENDEPIELISIPRAPAAPDPRGLGLGDGRSFEDWAPKVPAAKSGSWYRREVSFTLPTVVILLLLHALLTAVLVQTLQVLWAPRPATTLPDVGALQHTATPSP
ncbi:MAG: protein kinase [Polyangiales bacterium]